MQEKIISRYDLGQRAKAIQASFQEFSKRKLSWGQALDVAARTAYFQDYQHLCRDYDDLVGVEASVEMILKANLSKFPLTHLKDFGQVAVDQCELYTSTISSLVKSVKRMMQENFFSLAREVLYENVKDLKFRLIHDFNGRIKIMEKDGARDSSESVKTALEVMLGRVESEAVRLKKEDLETLNACIDFLEKSLRYIDFLRDGKLRGALKVSQEDMARVLENAGFRIPLVSEKDN